MGRVKAEMAHTIQTDEKRHRAPRNDALIRTWDIKGATIAPMRHREPLVPIPKARIVVG